MNQPLVSCIIPAFNAQHFIVEAVESIINQSYQNIEIIVVDDGSTDNTIQQLSTYKNLKIISQVNRGPAAARNAGFRASQGQLIAFLDADDKWNLHKIKKQTDLLFNSPELGFCVTLIQNFWIPELKDEEERFKNHRIAQPQPGYLCQALLVRREVFEKVGLLNETIGAGDATDWFIRAKEQGVQGQLMNEVLVHRRLHRNNRSRHIGQLPQQAILESIRQSLKRKGVS